jgi:hypothetical protein
LAISAFIPVHISPFHISENPSCFLGSPPGPVLTAYIASVFLKRTAMSSGLGVYLVSIGLLVLASVHTFNFSRPSSLPFIEKEIRVIMRQQTLDFDVNFINDT